MKVIVLGISGLIGSYVFKECSKKFNTFGTLRKSKKEYEEITLFKKKKIIYNIDILNFNSLLAILNDFKPDFIINCIGITKRKINKNIDKVIEVNSLYPHKLANWGLKNNSKVVHFSTDCVFNGLKGNYDENSPTDAFDIYGKTKALGEINYKHTLTIRSSFIGAELYDKTELLEWVFSKNGKKINGFKKTMYSGVSTLFLAKFIVKIINENISLSGLYNLAPQKPISKYDLICIIKEKFKLKLEIIPDNEIIHNPTLNGTKLRSKLNFKIPTWDTMLNNLSKYKI